MKGASGNGREKWGILILDSKSFSIAHFKATWDAQKVWSMYFKGADYLMKWQTYSERLWIYSRKEYHTARTNSMMPWKKLSDTELDRVFASSKLGTTSHRQPEVTWNHKNNIDGHGNFKHKSSRARMFFHAIQGVWEHLKGWPVWDSWDRQLPASRFCFSVRVLTRHYKEGKIAYWYLFLWYVCIFLYINTKPLHFAMIVGPLWCAGKPRWKNFSQP